MDKRALAWNAAAGPKDGDPFFIVWRMPSGEWVVGAHNGADSKLVPLILGALHSAPD